MTGYPPFVRRDHQLQVGDALRWNRPLLALKRRAWWTEGILLPQQCLVGMPSVSRDRHVELLRTAYVTFLDFEAKHAQGLRGIEGQEQPLWSRCSGDPAAPPGTAVVVEGMGNRVIGRFRGHPHGRERRDVFFFWPSDPLCWVVRKEVFPQHDSSCAPLMCWAGP